MSPLHSTGGLLGRAVAFDDVRLGVCVDALLDHRLERLVGLDVLSGDTAHRFLPFPACEVQAAVIAVDSSLVLLDRELDFYRLGGRSFSDLRGLPVRRSGAHVGSLADLLVDDEGDVRTIVVSTPAGELELEPRQGLVLGNLLLRPAV
jgi:hypothetical protein